MFHASPAARVQPCAVVATHWSWRTRRQDKLSRRHAWARSSSRPSSRPCGALAPRRVIRQTAINRCHCKGTAARCSHCAHPVVLAQEACRGSKLLLGCFPVRAPVFWQPSRLPAQECPAPPRKPFALHLHIALAGKVREPLCSTRGQRSAYDRRAACKRSTARIPQPGDLPNPLTDCADWRATAATREASHLARVSDPHLYRGSPRGRNWHSEHGSLSRANARHNWLNNNIVS